MELKFTKLLSIRLLVALFLLLGASSLSAQTTYTWVGGAGTSGSPVDYAIATNWSPSRTSPATNDILVFNLTNVDGASTAGNIFLSNITNETIGQLQIIQSAYTTGRSVTFSGTATTLTISGDLIIGGTNTRLNDGGYTISIGGTLQYLGSSSYQVHASANYNTGSLSGKLLFTGATPTYGLNATGGNIGAGNVEVSSSTNLTINSAANAFTVNGNLHINSGGKVTMNNKTLQLTSGGANSAGTSTAGVGGTISGSGVVVGSASSSLNINQSGALASGSQTIGTINFDPTSAATSTVNGITFNRSLGVLTIGTTNSNTLTIPGGITFTAGGRGTINDGGNNITVAGNIAAGSGGVFTSTGSGRLTMTGSARTIAGATFQNLTLSSNSSTFTLTGSDTITGTLSITGSSNLSLGASTFNLVMANGSTIARSNTTGGIINSGSGNLIYGTTAGDRVNINISASNTSTLELNGNTTNGGIGTLTVTSGTYTFSPTTSATINTALTLNGGNITIAASKTLIMADGSTINRSATTSGLTATGTLQYGTSSTHRVNINIGASVTSAGELAGTTGGIGTLTVSSGTYTLAASPTVNTKLLMSGGTISFASSARTVTMANRSIIERSVSTGGFTSGTNGSSILFGTAASDTVTVVCSATSGTVSASYEIPTTSTPGKIGSIMVTGNGGTYSITSISPTIAANFIVSAGATFNGSGQSINWASSGVSIVEIYGTVQTAKGNGIGGSFNSTFSSTNSPTITFYNGSTAEYNATNTGQTISPLTYHHLKVTGNRTTGTGGLSFSGGTVTINGDFTASTDITGSTIAFPVQSGTIVFGGSGTQNVTFSNSCDSSGTARWILGNVTINSGVTLVSNKNLVITGNLGGTGSFSGSQKITMLGTAKTIAGSTITNLDVNTATITQSGSPVTYSGTITINGNPTTFTGNVNVLGGTLAYGASATGVFNPSSILNIQAGTVNFNSRPITLQANASSTAAIVSTATLSNATNVTLQQWVTGQRGYRILSNPFSTALSKSTIGTANGITISGTNDVKTYNSSNNTWSNNISSISANTPYSVFIRGLSSEVNGLTYSAGPTAFAYNVTGTLNGNTVTLNQNNSNDTAWTIAGNPFAAPVNSSALTGGAAGTPYYIYSMAQNNTGTRVKAGGWVAASSNSSATTPIPMMGVVAYQAKTTSGTTFDVTTASINTANTAQTGLFGEGDAITQLELQLTKDGNYQDKLFVRFDANSTEKGNERMDLRKLDNDVTNIYTLTSDKVRLAVDARRGIDNIIPIGVTSSAGKYSFTVASNNFVNASNIYLIDKYTNTKTALEPGATYSFEITSDAATQGDNRFELGTVKTVAQDVAASNDNFSVKVLGNVVNNAVTVQVRGAKSSSVQITVLDMQGKLISNTTSSREVNSLSLANGSGMYLIKVTDGANSIISKVVKP